MQCFKPFLIRLSAVALVIANRSALLHPALAQNGPQVVQVPSVVGQPAGDAKARILSAGLKTKLHVGWEAPSKDLEFRAYAQTPAAGISVPTGRTIDIVFFGGSPSGTPGTVPTEVISQPPLDQGAEQIDLRSGRLQLQATDMIVSAAALKLVVRRTLQPVSVRSGLLGLRWRLNWETQLIPSLSAPVIETEAELLAFR